MTKLLKLSKLIFPAEVIRIFRNLINLFRDTGDIIAIYKFIFTDEKKFTVFERAKIVLKYIYISFRVDCAHTHEEILSFSSKLMNSNFVKNGVVVEAGCFKGGSSSKFSIITNLLGYKLIIFDSFEGIPANNELHASATDPLAFPEGSYTGSLNEVRSNIARFGNIKNCYFVKGWFEDTMPKLNVNVLSAYIDVDLVSSTKTCLKYLYPLIRKNGSIFSQDGHLPLVTEVLADKSFWELELQVSKPEIIGLGNKKLVEIRKN